MKPKLWLSVLGLVLCCLALSSPLCAQDSEPDEESVDPVADKSAFLSLQVDDNGTVHFNLSSAAVIAGNSDLTGFFTQRWRCTFDREDRTDTSAFRRLSAEQQARIVAARKEVDKHTLAGTCSGPLQKRGLSVQGSFDVQPLLVLLRQDGITHLSVYIVLPITQTQAISGPPANQGSGRSGFYSYELQVDGGAQPFSVSFGYSRSGLLRMGFYTALFVIVPVLIVLIMRFAALRRGSTDPAGAWFSFMKTMQVCVNGSFLLWGMTHLNTRSQILELVRFAGWTSAWRSVLATVLVITVPSWLAYLLCTALSYKVFLRIRNVSSTWTQFMARQLAQMGKVFFPLTLYLAGILTMLRNARAGFTLICLAWVSHLVCTLLYQKLEKSHPSAITSGPLRDRIFALAQSMGVKIRQVFVVPAAQSAVANAFATTKQTVLFTDYLIEKLSQREVDAVAAHELTHLRHSHAQKLSFMLLGVIFLPGLMSGFLGGLIQALLLFVPLSARLRLTIGAAVISDWAQLAVMLGFFWIYYFIRKRFEYAADAGAVQVTRDPEAMITALAKISRLNLTPIQWSRSSEAMLTHPSTMRRLERIAQSCGMPSTHLQQLIAQSEKTPETSAPVEGYVVTPSTTGVVSMGRSSGRAQRSLFILMALHLLPPAAIAFCLHQFLPKDGLTGWRALAGALLSVALYHLGSGWMSRSNNRHMMKSVIKAMTGKTAPFRVEDGIPVGFAPTPYPRFFVSGYNWDHGLLFFSADKIVFMGSHASFGLRRDQIRSVLLGHGAPSWRNWQRVYFSWEDKTSGKSGTFNLLPLFHRKLFQVDARNLYLQVRSWRNEQGPSTAGNDSSELGAPAFGAVTSMSPKEVNKFSRTVGITAILLGLGAGISMLLKLQNDWFVPGTVLLIRIVESIPYWRYRERPLVYDVSVAPVLTRPASRAVVPPPPPPPQAQQESVEVGEEVTRGLIQT